MSRSVRHTVLRVVFLLSPFFATAASGQELIAAPDTATRTLNEKWDWGTGLAAQSDETSAWVAYQFSVQIDEKLGVAISSYGNDYYQWNNHRGRGGRWHYSDSSRWNNGLSISSLLAGNETAQQDFLIPRDLLLLANYSYGELREIRLVEADTVVNWRAAPIYWLGRVSEQESFRFLVGLMGRAGSPNLDRAIAKAIGLHRDSDRDSFLVSALDDEAFSTLRLALLESLALQESPEAMSALMGLARDANEAVTARRIAISALSRYDSADVEALLITLAGNLNPQDIRKEAVESLGAFISVQASQALAEIVQGESNAEVVEEALRSLSLRPDQFETIRDVALSHSNSELREEAISIMGGMDRTRAFDILTGIAEADASYDVREEAISEIEDAPPSLAVPYLIAFAQAQNGHPLDIRMEAVESLGSFDPALVTTALNQLAWSDANEDLREEAVESLADLEDAQADQLLLELARKHPSSHTRSEALDKLQDNLL